MHIKNLTNSPYSLLNKDGEKVMIPALGTIDIDPHPMHAEYYSKASFLAVSESTVINDTDPRESLRAEYAQISGVSADKRWSATRLRTKIDSLMESQK